MSVSLREMKARITGNLKAFDFDKRQEKINACIRNSRLLDDSLMTVVFNDNIKAAQLVIRTILQRDDLIVKQAVTQDTLKNLRGHSVRLDIHAVDADNNHYNIEIQRAKEGANFRRARYNSSLLDSDNLPEGADYTMLPDNYIIFITETDVLKGGKAVYNIDKRIRETNQEFDDGVHIVYVNASITEDSDIGRLMYDFRMSDARQMHNKELADSVRYFKEDEEGVNIMCDLVKEIFRDEIEEVREEGEARGREEGEIIGKIKLLYQDFEMSVSEIALKLKMSEEQVENIVKEEILCIK